MDMKLTNKRAFISGSTQGIGYAIATALAREGVVVIINGRDDARVQLSVQKLQADVPGARVSGIAADFAGAAQAHAHPRLQAALDEIGPVDILVNNVGLFDVTPFAEISDDDWARYFAVNVMSGVRLSRALLPGMLASGWGRILFIGSESGVNVPADMLHYGVTKAGMLALSNGLAKLTRGTGVTVNTILGGPTYSDGVAGSIRNIAAAQHVPADALKASIIGANTTTLLERFIEPEEIAHLAAYLCSPLSSATNGSAVRADGGVLTSML